MGDKNDTVFENVTFEELKIGQKASLSRTLTREDIELVAITAGVISAEEAEEVVTSATPYSEILGHGICSGSLLSTLLGTVLPGPGTSCLNQSIEFRRPILVGDTISASVTVAAKREDEPIAVLDCLFQNELGETVVAGQITVRVPTEKVRFRRTEVSRVHFKHKDLYRELIDSCSGLPALKTAVVHPVSTHVMTAIDEAVKEGLIEPVLVGPEQRIHEAAREARVNITDYRLVNCEHSHAAAVEAVRLAASGKVQGLMKGALHTEELLRALLPSNAGLRTERKLSHAYVMDIPAYHKPLIITDAALNIMPDLETKVDICHNSIVLWHSLFGTDRVPKVAILAAVETVSQRMQATIDAACLCKMAQRGQIADGILDGPLALDLAISPQAVEKKNIDSSVAGDADILVVPNIEAGNMVAKQLTFLGNSDAAGLLLGARVPVILASRSDNLRTRLMSCALAVRVAEAREKGTVK